MKKRYLKGLSLAELKQFTEELGFPKFRGQQIFNWLYNNLSDNFDLMLNLPKGLRNQLKEVAEINSLKIIETQKSVSGTIKYLFTTSDNREVEAVAISDNGKFTLCLSTQVGCPLDCKFCATGALGYKRNLDAGEIIDQYICIARELGKDNITNLVYMGMGEPLLNYKGTIRSLETFTSEFNKGISRTRITVSTSGIPEKIKELADCGLRVKLALSLHSPFEDIRSKIMPINTKYSLKDTLEACKYYASKTGTRITLEYTMLSGINDRKEDAKQLVKICRSMPSKINIIPFNSISHIAKDPFSISLKPTNNSVLESFADYLRNNNITVMVRKTQGSDIAAACGQLAATKRK